MRNVRYLYKKIIECEKQKVDKNDLIGENEINDEV
jgi:hypothetical protein